MKASGYETDESQVPRRRTSRVTTPVQLGPGMIQPSQDSRRALNSLPSSIAPSNASASNAPSSITHSRKRVRSASRSDNDCEIVGGHIVPNKASKSKKTGSQKTTALMTKGKKNSGSTASQTHKPAPCMNLPQDSDNDNARIRKRTKVSQAEKAGEEEEEEYDDICLYFDAPTHGTDNDLNEPPIEFKCKYCHKKCRGHGTSRSNLKIHRDGSNQAGRSKVGCPRHKDAIAQGCKLPPTVAERHTKKMADKHKVGTMKNFVTVIPKFDVKTFNRIMMLWQVRHALPWSRIEDPLLRAAFYYLKPDARLFHRKWSADEAKHLHLHLCDTVYNELQSIPGKFTLTHDVWTVKGNLWAFIGGVASYINKDWNFVSRHVTLKRVAHHHKGAWLAEPLVTVLKKRDMYKKMLAHTTDSASNNVTLATEMHRQLQEHHGRSTSTSDEYSWNPDTMHVKCMCHKIGLIVNAGIAALGLPISQDRHSVLGFFPSPENLPTIIEDGTTDYDEDSIDPSIIVPSDEESDVEHGEDELSNAENEDGDDVEDEDWDMEDIDVIPKPKSRVNGLKVLTQDLDFVVKKITRSSAWRKDSNARRLDPNRKRPDGDGPGRSLIAGHGIRWNVCLDRWERAYENRDVIDDMLKEDASMAQSKKSRHSKKAKKPSGYFQETFFSIADWRAVRDLLDELRPFKTLTKRMEANAPTGCMVLAEYHRLLSSLKTRCASLPSDDRMGPFLQACIERTKVYFDKALGCDTLLMATVFHPALRMKLFNHTLGLDHLTTLHATEYLHEQYTERQYQMRPPSHSESPSRTHNEESNQMPDIYRLYNHESNAVANKLDIYLKGTDPLTAPGVENSPMPVLQWWKEHQHKYPILASLARDYLSVPGSSAAAERTFSAATDVTTAVRGRLNPRTIEMCVGSRLWIREGVEITADEYEDVGLVLQSYEESTQKIQQKGKT